MATTAMDNIEGIERQRVLLEDSITKLRRSLRHWQTWEAEYEGLKEEIQGLDGQPDSEILLRVGREYGGSLVNEKEIEELLGLKSGLQRDSKQIVDIVSRRQEYVQQNIKTIEKQVDALERRISALEGTSEPEAKEVTDEGALPLTEITEQLDDDGNIISATTSKPSEVEPQIREALRKAGVKNVQQGQPAVEQGQNRSNDHKIRGQAAKDTKQLLGQVQASGLEAPDVQDHASKPSQKSVSFAEDTKPAASTIKQKAMPTSIENRVSALDVAKDLPAGERLVELDDEDNILGTTTVESNDDSIEDAVLRREMLQYTMEEVGAIVAELDLEDEISDGSYDDYEGQLDDQENDGFTSEPEGEEEDEYGRTTNKVITDDYRMEMMELEKRLSARMIEVVGPDTWIADAKDAGVSAIGQNFAGHDDARNATNYSAEKQPNKKAVTFAGETETISPGISDGMQQAKEASEPKPRPSPESIIERVPPAKPSAAETETEPGKVSRFKSRRQNSANTLAYRDNSQGPTDQIIASNLVERATTKRGAAAPNLDGLDPALHEREVARQLHDKRNSLIQQQGGFMPSQEEIENPLMEERDGKVRKVSRFRAARLNASGV